MVYSSNLTRSQESYRQRKTYRNRANNSGLIAFFLTFYGFIFLMFLTFTIIGIIIVTTVK